MLDPKTNLNYKQSSTFIETLQDKLKNINNFSNWSAKEQMVTVTTIGTIFGVLFPIVTIALPVAATGAAIALTLFFAIKAVEYGYKGLKWSSEKTWKGSKYTTDKIKNGTVYIKDSVKKGTHLIRDRITDARNALAVAIYDDREKYEDRSEIKKTATNKKEDRILKSSLKIRNNMFYGDDISKSRRSAEKKTTNVIKYKYQSHLESGTIPTATAEQKPSDKKTIPVLTPMVPEMNLSSSFTQEKKSDYVVINMKDRNTECVDFDYYGSSSQRSSLNSSVFSTPTNEQNLSMEALQNEFERRFTKLHTSPNKLMKQQTPSTQLYEQEHTPTIRNRLEKFI